MQKKPASTSLSEQECRTVSLNKGYRLFITWVYQGTKLIKDQRIAALYLANY